MAFFEPPRSLPESRIPPDPPEDELPAIVALERYAYPRSCVVVALSHAEVYRGSCSFHVRIIVRRDDMSRRRWATLEEVMFDELCCRDASEGLPDDLVRFGVQYADGTKATTLEPLPPSSPPRRGEEVGAPRPAIYNCFEGASGAAFDKRGPRQFDHDDTLRLFPLPPSEPFDVVVEWPTVGVPLTRVPLEGGVLRRGAERVRSLWPDENG